MVRSDLVTEENLIPGEAVTVLCAHGDMVLYPLARVTINMEGIETEVKAAVLQSLLVSVLLGTDTAQLEQLLQSNLLALHMSSLEKALVTTRGQSRQQAEEEREQQKCEARSGVQPRQVTEDTPTQERLKELGGSTV